MTDEMWTKRALCVVHRLVSPRLVVALELKNQSLFSEQISFLLKTSDLDQLANQCRLLSSADT